MTIKSFLVPILALAALGVPASASVVTYCDGGGCGGTNTTAAFDNSVTTDGYTYANGTDLTFSGAGPIASPYTDLMTDLIFSASGGFTVASGGLEASAGGTITISVPAIYNVVLLNLSQPGGGNVYTFLDSNENTYTYLAGTSQEVGFATDTPGSPWTITLIPSNGSERITIDSFNPAGAQQQGGGGAETPEVGTLLLIGTGLIAMRWMRRARPRIFRTPQPA